jgi:hypothetical protein
MTPEEAKRELIEHGGNRFGVTVRQLRAFDGVGQIVIVMPPMPGQPLTVSEALNLSAWLVAMCNLTSDRHRLELLAEVGNHVNRILES